MGGQCGAGRGGPPARRSVQEALLGQAALVWKGFLRDPGAWPSSETPGSVDPDRRVLSTGAPGHRPTQGPRGMAPGSVDPDRNQVRMSTELESDVSPDCRE